MLTPPGYAPPFPVRAYDAANCRCCGKTFTPVRANVKTCPAKECQEKALQNYAERKKRKRQRTKAADEG